MPCLRHALAGIVSVAVGACAAVAVAQTRSGFEGMWSTTFTLSEDPGWLAEDFFCFFGCTASEYEYMGNLLDDPANDERSLIELSGESAEHGRQEFLSLLEPAVREEIESRTLVDQLEDICTPYGFFAMTISVLPLQISQEEGRILLTYETHNTQRVAYLRDSAPPPPDEPTRLGHSVAYYEGDELVIETTGVRASPFYVSKAYGIKHSDRLTGVERYSLGDGGRELEMFVSIEDPEVLAAPWVWVKKWRIAPDLELEHHEYDCSFVPGQR